MIINHNISAVFTNRILAQTERELSKSIEKLASGVRINKAGDDASGLAVSETLRSQIRGLEQAQKMPLTVSLLFRPLKDHCSLCIQSFTE